VAIAKNSIHVQSASDCIPLTVETASTRAQLLELKRDYELLLSQCRNRMPFALHEWHVAWCDCFLRQDGPISSQQMIFVLRDRNRRCVAIIPMILTTRTVGPLRIKTLDLIGADPAMTEIRTSLILPGFESQSAWAIQREVEKIPNLDWIQWGSVGGKFGETLAIGAPLIWQDSLIDFILELPPSWEALRNVLKRNIRESIRHGYNSLKRQSIEFEFRVAKLPDDVAAALEIFFALHGMRASLEGTTAHRNHFSADLLRNFLRGVCAQLAARNMVRVFQLVIAGRVVATRIGFVVEDSLYLYYSGFDPQWARYGVMTTTLTEALKSAIDEGLKAVNFSPGKDVSKTRWGPREVAFPQAVQVQSSAKSKLAWEAFQRMNRARGESWLATGLSRFAARKWV